MNWVEIGNRKIGPGSPCFIIAEAGVNHNGDLKTAIRMIDVAAEAGVDAVKFQTYTAEDLVTKQAPKAEYQRAATDSTESQLEMLKRTELSPEDFLELNRHCCDRGIFFLSSPFDEKSADLLEELGVPAYKIPSGEITNWRLLEHIAKKGKTVILSTGMSYLSEVDDAVRIIKEAGCEQIILLHCVSLYPTDPTDVNLRAMHTLETAFQLTAGFSDHTLGIEVAIAAVALGASVIEKHFTLDRNLPGPDHRASLEPSELKALVTGIRKVEAAFGHDRKEPMQSELQTAAVARKSLVAAKSINAGTCLTEDLIAAKRPGTGLPPSMKSRLIGRRLKRDVVAGTIISMEMLE